MFSLPAGNLLSVSHSRQLVDERQHALGNRNMEENEWNYGQEEEMIHLKTITMQKETVIAQDLSSVFFYLRQ